MKYKLCLIILLLLFLLKCCFSNRIENFKDELNIIDRDQYNKLQQLSDGSANLDKNVISNIDNTVTNLNLKLKSTEAEFSKDKKKNEKILKQCSAKIVHTQGFDKLPQKACDNRDILGETSTSIGRCAENCKKNKECLSFSYDRKKGNCRLSASCYDLNSKKNDKYDTYVKKNVKLDDYPLTKFNVYLNKKCKFADDMKPPIKNISLIDCANKCNKDDKCISYHFKKGQGYSGDCYLSEKCFMGGCTSDNPEYNLFTKYHFNSEQVKYKQCTDCKKLKMDATSKILDINDMDSPSKDRMIKLAGTNMCMNMTGRVGNGQNIYLWTCNPNDKNERFWYYKPLQQVRAKHGNYSLNFDHSPHKGTSIIQWQGINDWSNRLIYDKNTRSFKSPYRNQCVTNSNNRNVNRNNIISYDCLNGENQKWEIGIFDSNGKQL
jgi:hypothetical protein